METSVVYPRTQEEALELVSLSREANHAFMLKPDHHQPSPMIPQLDCSRIMANQSAIMKIGSPPVQEINPFINNNNNQSLELLAQLQAIINMTTHQARQETNYYQPHFFDEGSSSSSTSSMVQENIPTVPVVPVQSTMPCSSFSWSEFLVEDAFLLSTQQNFEYGFSSTDSSSQIITPNELSSAGRDTNQNYNIKQEHEGTAVYPVTNVGESSEASSLNEKSFIEALLDLDRQLLREFPSLLEEPF